MKTADIIAAVAAKISAESEGKFALENSVLSRDNGCIVQGLYVRRNTAGVLLAKAKVWVSVKLTAGNIEPGKLNIGEIEMFA